MTTTLTTKNINEPQVYETCTEAMEVFLAEHPEVLDDDLSEQFDMWCERNNVFVKELDEIRADDLKAREGQY